jgi:hypothetical protein
VRQTSGFRRSAPKPTVGLCGDRNAIGPKGGKLAQVEDAMFIPFVFFSFSVFLYSSLNSKFSFDFKPRLNAQKISEWYAGFNYFIYVYLLSYLFE